MLQVPPYVWFNEENQPLIFESGIKLNVRLYSISLSDIGHKLCYWLSLHIRVACSHGVFSGA